MGKAIADSEKEKIIDLLGEGLSHCEIARRTGRSQSAVSALVKQHGIEPVQRIPRAQQAAREYNKLERMNLLNRAFDKAGELLERKDLSARDFKDLMTGIAIGIDKRRLEDGQAGQISEQRASTSGVLDLDKEFRKLDEELAEEHKRDEEVRNAS
jgi:predicted transcriptional regulator